VLNYISFLDEVNSMDIGLLRMPGANYGSIARMVEKVGGSVEYINNPDDLTHAEKLILPGVGSFDKAMIQLKKKGFIDILVNRIVADNIPILGICLGMQLLCNNSEEGDENGLGLIDAEVKKFRFYSECTLKVPHMGWNIVRAVRDNPLISSTGEYDRFYFVHSYYVEPNDTSMTIGTANYGHEFCASFQKDNIFGVQFHPEKSHRYGMGLMKRFLDI